MMPKTFPLSIAIIAALSACGSQYPLQEAVKDHNTNRIVELLRENTDVNLRDRKGNTALHYATVSKAMTDLLIAAGADPNLTNDDGETPLHMAAYGSDIGVIESLLLNGADPNAVDSDGNTPLHLAVGWEDVYSVKQLLAFGANVAVTNRYGRSPVNLAEMNRNETILTLLTQTAR